MKYCTIKSCVSNNVLESSFIFNKKTYRFIKFALKWQLSTSINYYVCARLPLHLISLFQNDVQGDTTISPDISYIHVFFFWPVRAVAAFRFHLLCSAIWVQNSCRPPPPSPCRRKKTTWRSTSHPVATLLLFPHKRKYHSLRSASYFWATHPSYVFWEFSYWWLQSDKPAVCSCLNHINETCNCHSFSTSQLHLFGSCRIEAKTISSFNFLRLLCIRYLRSEWSMLGFFVVSWKMAYRLVWWEWNHLA